MKSANPHAPVRDDPLHSMLHFIGGFVREGENQDARLGHALLQQVGDAVSQDSRLTTPRPSDDHQRTIDVLSCDNLALGERRMS